MPDTENKRLAILDELDKFNTAPEADSLMLGILQEEEAKNNRLAALDNQQEDQVPGDQPQPQPEPQKEVEGKLPNDYLPLNTSIQDLNSRFENRFSGLERSLNSLANSIASAQQHRQQEPAQQQYDPNEPVTYQHMQTLAQRQDMAYNMGLRAYKQNLLTRAHLEYQRFKTKHPDFNLDPAQLDYAVEAMARDNKLEQLEGTNWQGQFSQLYEPQRQTHFDTQSKEIEALKKEIETLKKTAARTPVQAQPVSPSTGRSSRSPAAISTPLAETNADKIVGLKTFRKKGDFKGFAKEAFPHLRQA